MLYVGLDLSRKRLDWQALLPDGERRARRGAARPGRARQARAPTGRCGRDRGRDRVDERRPLRPRPARARRLGRRYRGALEASRDRDARLQDGHDRTWWLAELARLQLVPEIWLPEPAVRAEREQARFRLHLVKHRSALKNRIHAILFQHGVPSPTSDLFGAGGRALLARLRLPERGRRRSAPA